MSRWDNDVVSDVKKGSDPLYIKFEANKAHVCRLVDSDNYLKVFRSWVKGDDGKKHEIVVGVEKYDPIKNVVVVEWSPFKDIIGDPRSFYAGGLLESIKGPDGKKLIQLQLQNPEIYNMVCKNEEPTNDDERGWAAGVKFVFKAISRSKHVDMETSEVFDYCETNKTLRILEATQGIFNGIDALRKTHGNCDDYDISIIQQTGVNGASGYKGTRYAVTKPDPATNPNFQRIIKIGKLTPAELEYASPDFDSIYKVTTADELINIIGGKIEHIDICLGTDYAAKLKDTQAGVSSRVSASSGAKPQVAASFKPAAPASEPEAPQNSFSNDSAIPDVSAPAAPQAPAQGRLAAKAAAQSKQPVTVVCGQCKKVISANVDFCDCGTPNLVPCDACGVSFSQWIDTCPSCGHKYS